METPSRQVPGSDRIGKYEILSRIGAGGMADVYRCRLRGVGGFEKVVVVKRIRPERAADPAFVDMFLDEARLAASLDHPNIVQVFDVGEVDGSPYIAMEYVKGPTLSALVREAHRRGDVCLGQLAHIVAGVCQGLHHAHTAAGADGQPLGLVHRDVSGQNIIISREGVPKLLDFGLAKADGRLTESQAGTLKGKLRYLAPERLTGVVDQRGDIFSLGVCLFEATTGQNPYGPPGTEELALLGRIASGTWVAARPSQLVPGYPAALEEIVLWALEPDVSKRCPSARALHERLEDFVSRPPFLSSTRNVALWVETLFPASPVEDSGPPPRPRPATARITSTWSARRRPSLSPFNPLAAVLSPDTGNSLDPVPSEPADGGRKRRLWWLAAAGTTALVGAAVLTLWLLHQTPPPRSASPPIAAQPVPVVPRAVATAAPAAAAIASTSPPPPESPRVRPVRRLTRAVSPPAPSAPSPRSDASDVRASALSPSAGDDGDPASTYSRRPLARVPPPNLPPLARPRGADEIRRALRLVEQESLRAGCSPAFVRGVTATLERRLIEQPSAEIYAASLYYLIVREAALGHSKQSAAQELATAHASGLLKALRLPVAQR